MVSKTDTIVAIATPPGRGGLGIVRISGPASPHLAMALSRRSSPLLPRQAHFCKIHDQNAGVIDEGLFIYFPAPASYTGEDVLEIHAHGSRIVLNQIVDHVLHEGGRLAGPGEFTERAYLNNKMDLVQAESVADLIDAVSQQAARSAMRSLEGEFSEKINRLLEQIIHLRTFVEGALDFPDEEVDFISGSDIGAQLTDISETLDRIMARARQGAILKEGVSLAIIGRPNVGKSTLLNRLAGRDAAIVTDIAGTTRDLVEQDILLDGIPLRLVDTAGLRETENRIEREGIRRTHDAASKADIVVYLREYNKHDNEDEAWLKQYSDRKRLLVSNKIDIHGIAPEVENIDENTAMVLLSAKTGAGMDLFVEQLKNMIGVRELSEDIFTARKRHIHALEATLRHVLSATVLAGKNNEAELLAEELQQAQKSLGEITGEYAADDLLGSIFSSFCIGK